MAVLFVLLVIFAFLTPWLYPNVADLFEGPESCPKSSFQLKSLETALTSYKIETNRYPTTEQGLRALVAKPATVMPQKAFHRLISPELMIDSWNHEFQYRIPGIHNPDGYDVWSLGADGVSGTEDDIGNW